MPLFGFESDALVSPWSAFKVNEAINDSSFQTFIIKNATVYLKAFNPNVWPFLSFFFFFTWNRDSHWLISPTLHLKTVQRRSLG